MTSAHPEITVLTIVDPATRQVIGDRLPGNHPIRGGVRDIWVRDFRAGATERRADPGRFPASVPPAAVFSGRKSELPPDAERSRHLGTNCCGGGARRQESWTAWFLDGFLDRDQAATAPSAPEQNLD
jgi:hypothetical protein